jgi:hypothetical protein
MSYNNCCDPCQGYYEPYEPYQYYEPYLYYDENGILREDYSWLRRAADAAKRGVSKAVNVVKDAAGSLAEAAIGPLKEFAAGQFQNILNGFLGSAEGKEGYEYYENIVDYQDAKVSFKDFIRHEIKDMRLTLTVVKKAFFTLLESYALKFITKVASGINALKNFVGMIPTVWSSIWGIIKPKLNSGFDWLVGKLNTMKETIAKHLGFAAQFSVDRINLDSVAEGYEYEDYGLWDKAKEWAKGKLEEKITSFIKENAFNFLSKYCSDTDKLAEKSGSESIKDHVCAIRRNFNEIVLHVGPLLTKLKEFVVDKYVKPAGAMVASGFEYLWKKFGKTAVDYVIKMAEKGRDKLVKMLGLPDTFKLVLKGEGYDGAEYFQDFEYYIPTDYEPYVYNNYCNC